VSLARQLTDTLTFERSTDVEDDYGTHEEWTPTGVVWRCKLQLVGTYETVAGRDTVVNQSTATGLGHPDIKPKDRGRDQHDRLFAIDGDVDFTGTSRKPFTIARLRSAEDL
jgi:hypothetical protein